jgi:hypothetical protein
MSRICEHEQLNKYLLRRNTTKWGIINNETKNLEFALFPNWVKENEESLCKK